MGNTNSEAFMTELEKKEKRNPTVKQQHQLKIGFYKDLKFIKYDSKINKWVGYINLPYFHHPVGYYDTPEEAVNKVLDKLYSIFGKSGNMPSEYLENLATYRV
jgi:hypothetical protein